MKVYLSFDELDVNEAVSLLAAAGASVIYPNEYGAAKPKRPRRTKKEIAADKEKASSNTEIFDVPDTDSAPDTADVPLPAPDTADVPLPDSEPTGDLTEDNVRVALSAVNEVQGLKGAKAVLKQFNAERITDVDTKDYAKFLEVCAKETA